MVSEPVNNPILLQQIHEHPYPLLFATISGAHLYGFPSPDSDFDLRGAHIRPASMMLGLQPYDDTVEKSGIRDGLELDLVTHDVDKFFHLMLRKNGYVLEQLLSPLVVHTTAEHEELIALAPACITRHHAHHYLGFAATQWKLLQKDDPPRVKPLLYLYRVLLTGITLMRTGVVEANLTILNDEAKLPYLDELIAAKLEGVEKECRVIDRSFHEREYERLRSELEEAHLVSQLPETSSAFDALNDLLVRIRVATLNRI